MIVFNMDIDTNIYESQKKYRQTEKGKVAYARANLKYQSKYRKHLKETVFNHYGAVCKICGDTDLSKLSIDHPNENGKEHRAEIHNTGGHHFYRWLINQGFPEGYQTLCLGGRVPKQRIGMN